MNIIQKIESNIYDAYTNVFYPMTNDDKITAVAAMILLAIGLALTITNANICLACVSIENVSIALTSTGGGIMMALMFKNFKYPEKSLVEFKKYYNEMDKLGFIKKKDETNTLDANSKV